MKAAIYCGNREMRVTDIPAPNLYNRDGAIIKVKGCGLCGSDIVKISKNLVPEGTVLGHEVVGIIKEINSSENHGLQVGDRVALAHHVPCYNCRYCEQASYSMCNTFKKTNLDPGGFAEYTYISGSHLQYNTKKIPDHVNDIQASLMEPLGCVLRALSRANLSAGQTVLTIGLGFIGLLFIQAIKLFDCFAIGCDLIDERIFIASELGADLTLNSSDVNGCIESINKKIKFAGVDVVILCSGSDISSSFAMSAIRDGGKIIVFSSIPNDNIGFLNNQVYYRELSIIGAYSATPEFLDPAINYIKNNQISIGQYYKTMDIKSINSAVEKNINHQTIKNFILL